jgi:very-short-patch-repair endonuclease
MTPPEWILWSHIRNWRDIGYKFRRQHPIGPYVVDFACLSSRLVIEVDGEIHDYMRTHDATRQHYLECLGHRVLRFQAVDVFRDIDAVLDAIYAQVSLAPPLPLPAKRGGRG